MNQGEGSSAYMRRRIGACFTDKGARLTGADRILMEAFTMSTMKSRTGWLWTAGVTILGLAGATACSSNSSPASSLDAASDAPGTTEDAETPPADSGSEAATATEAGTEGGRAEGGSTEGGQTEAGADGGGAEGGQTEAGIEGGSTDGGVGNG